MPDSVSDMRTTIQIVFTMVREAFLSRAALHLENLALRQQLAVVHRKSPRPSLGTADRLFWVVPPFYLIRATNGSFAVGGDALFTAKEAKCFPAFGFVCLPSARLSARQDVRRVHGDPGGVFIATREPSNRTQRCSGREPLVPMMEPADLWKRHDLSDTAGLSRSSTGGVLAQRKMRSGSVVIIEVRNKDPSRMPFIQDDHVVQAFAPHAADKAFNIRILPRASWCCDNLFHAHRHHSRADEATAVVFPALGPPLVGGERCFPAVTLRGSGQSRGPRRQGSRQSFACRGR